MNLKDFLIDNYIYIIIVIVLIIITIIGFLADKKKSDDKKSASANQNPNASPEPLPMNMPANQSMNYQPISAVNPVNNQMNGQTNNNQPNLEIGQIPVNNTVPIQQPLGQVPNNQPFFNSVSRQNPVNTNQSINNKGTIPSDTNNMFGINQNTGIPQNNTYTMPTPIPNNNLNNQMIAPLPTNPTTNIAPKPIPMAPTMQSSQIPNQNGFSNTATTPQPVSFVYGQNQNNNNGSM